MRAHYIIDSESWSSVDTWKIDADKMGWGAIDYYFTDALAAINLESFDEARRNLDSLLTFIDVPQREDEALHKANQIKSLLFIKEGQVEEGIELLKKAVEYEFSLPIEFGPPEIVKPSSELLGEVYEELGMKEEAKSAFEAQLKRTPKRRISLKALANIW